MWRVKTSFSIHKSLETQAQASEQACACVHESWPMCMHNVRTRRRPVFAQFFALRPPPLLPTKPAVVSVSSVGTFAYKWFLSGAECERSSHIFYYIYIIRTLTHRTAIVTVSGPAVLATGLNASVLIFHSSFCKGHHFGLSSIHIDSITAVCCKMYQSESVYDICICILCTQDATISISHNAPRRVATEGCGHNVCDVVLCFCAHQRQNAGSVRYYTGWRIFKIYLLQIHSIIQLSGYRYRSNTCTGMMKTIFHEYFKYMLTTVCSYSINYKCIIPHIV